jgi:integrase
MPLTLRPPRPGKTPNYEIRGTYLGVSVERSSGTHKRQVAQQILRDIEACIEQHGQYPAPEQKPRAGEPTFLSAAVAYMRDGGERCYMAPLLEHFKEIPLKEIDQEAIDTAAATLLPLGAPDYRNRRIYTPVSAVLHHALGDKCPPLRRPKGAKGRARTDFMWPDDAFAIIDEADKIDPEFGLYLRLLLYTGIRKSEGLAVLSADVKPEERAAWLRTSKNEDPRMLKLRQDIVGPLQAHLERSFGEKLFRFVDGGHFKHLLLRAKLAACGLPCPVRRPTGWKPPQYRLAFVGFHTFRHTWATWMRRYSGADVQGLVATGNWRDPRSAARYSHVVSRDEWDRVDNLPGPGTKRGKINKQS